MSTTGSTSNHSALGSVSIWINDLKQGSEAAARKIFERYYVSLRHVARKQLAGFPTRLVDDEDLALSVIDTLFRGARTGRFEGLRDREHLWGLLVLIARQQIVDHKRWETRIKRDVTKEFGDAADAEETELCDEDLTPDHLAEMKDQQEHLFQLLRTDELRRIAALKLEGYDNAEIAQLLDMSPRSVQRKVNQIYDCWERKLKDADDRGQAKSDSTDE